MIMKKLLMMIMVGMIGAFSSVRAADKDTRIQIGTGLLYERGWDLTVSVEHETNYHSAWEYFGNIYLKWDKCVSCGHVDRKSTRLNSSHIPLSRILWTCMSEIFLE